MYLGSKNQTLHFWLNPNIPRCSASWVSTKIKFENLRINEARPRYIDGNTRRAMMQQMRVLSVKRFESRMATLTEVDFKVLKNAVGKFYNIF